MTGLPICRSAPSRRVQPALRKHSSVADLGQTSLLQPLLRSGSVLPETPATTSHHSFTVGQRVSPFKRAAAISIAQMLQQNSSVPTQPPHSSTTPKPRHLPPLGSPRLPIDGRQPSGSLGRHSVDWGQNKVGSLSTRSSFGSPANSLEAELQPFSSPPGADLDNTGTPTLSRPLPPLRRSGSVVPVSSAIVPDHSSTGVKLFPFKRAAAISIAQIMRQNSSLPLQPAEAHSAVSVRPRQLPPLSSPRHSADGQHPLLTIPPRSVDRGYPVLSNPSRTASLSSPARSLESQLSVPSSPRQSGVHMLSSLSSPAKSLDRELSMLGSPGHSAELGQSLLGSQTHSVEIGQSLLGSPRRSAELGQAWQSNSRLSAELQQSLLGSPRRSAEMGRFLLGAPISRRSSLSSPARPLQPDQARRSILRHASVGSSVLSDSGSASPGRRAPNRWALCHKCCPMQVHYCKGSDSLYGKAACQSQCPLISSLPQLEGHHKSKGTHS